MVSGSAQAEFLVSCLCAAWCGTCREYRPAFEALARAHPEVGFAWVDVEDQPQVVDELDVENFPTLVIQRDERVLFCGPMLPQIGLLERLLASLREQDLAAAIRWVESSPERQAWQDEANVRARLEAAA